MNKMKSNFGKIHIYTGSGKGKTTAALGLAMRAAGNGAKVYIGQFMKGTPCGELVACRKLKKWVAIEQYGHNRYIRSGAESSVRHTELAKEGLLKAYDALVSKKYNIVILDEICMAVDFHLIHVDEVVDLVRSCPKNTELILTGRNAPEALVEMADLVSEIREVKHYYKKGVKARKCIEY